MDTDGIEAYLKKMLLLAAELGVETLVFGNGGARKIPEGVSCESVFANLRTIVEMMEVHAEKAGITICVEPLNSTETNIINSYGEAVALTTGLTYVTTMIDSYHVAMDAQNFDDVVNTPEKLRHLHTAYPIGRMVPSSGDDMTLYADFVKTVKRLSYNDKISIEGAFRATDSVGIRAEVKEGLETLKGLFAR